MENISHPIPGVLFDDIDDSEMKVVGDVDVNMGKGMTSVVFTCPNVLSSG